MRKIQADKLLDLELSTAFEMMYGELELVFHNGDTLVTDAPTTLYSMCLWGPLAADPRCHVTPAHHAASHGKFSNKWNTRIISAVHATAFEFVDDADPVAVSELMRLSFNSINVLYNTLIKSTRGYVMCVDVVNVRELYNDPFVKEIRRRVRAKEITVGAGYKSVTYQISTNPEYLQNPLARMMHCNSVKIDQVYQCIIARGNLTDVDGHVFNEPVLTCFFGGIKYLYDFVAESRSAVKALSSAESLIAESEYFSRKLRMVCSYIEQVVPGDCGTTRLAPWFVRPAVDLPGEAYRGDLPGLKGKNYLSPDGTLKEITGDETELIGTIIKIRSPQLCEHIHRGNVCSVCFGGMYRNVLTMRNIGYRFAITASAPIIQAVISVKHDDTIGAVGGIALDDSVRHVLTESKGAGGVMIVGADALEGLHLVIDKNNTPGMIDLSNNPESDDIKGIVKKLSSISVLSYYYADDPGLLTDLTITKSPSYCTLSPDLINYIAKVGMTFNAQGNYVINMSKFDPRQQLLLVPSVYHGKISDVRDIQRIIEGRASDKKARMQEGSMEEGLRTLYDIVARTINVNLVTIEIIMTAISVKSYDDFSIPAGADRNRMGMLKAIMHRRSLGPLMGFEDRLSALMSATAHNPEHRQSHIFDAMIKPHEAVRARKREGRS